jgi:hypothetical protein
MLQTPSVPAISMAAPIGRSGGATAVVGEDLVGENAAWRSGDGQPLGRCDGP